MIDAYPHRVLIGEIYLPLDRLMQYYGRDLKGAHLPFNFQLLQAPWKADAIARLVEDYEAALPDGAWPNWVLGNHDRPRIATRVGPEQAKVAAVLLLTLRGTPTLYYGDEIGVADVPIPPDQIRDPWALREPVSVPAAMRFERRCNGIVRPVPASPRRGPGCLWRTIGPGRTLRASTSSLSRFSVSTSGSWRSAEDTRRCALADTKP